MRLLASSKRIQPVVNDAVSKKLEVAQLVALCLQEYERLDAKLKDLESCRFAICQRIEGENTVPTTGRRLMELQIFLRQLDDAIGIQKKVVSQAWHAVEEGRRDYTKKQYHAKAMTKVQKKYKAFEQLESQRREQREADDLSQHCRPGA